MGFHKRGNRFLHYFPAGLGQAAAHPINISLTEQVSKTKTLQYRMAWAPVIDPLYDITVSSLSFRLHSNCGNYVFTSAPHVGWVDPRGNAYDAQLELRAGQTWVVNQFARTFHEVDAGEGLLTPSVAWNEWSEYTPTVDVSPSGGHLLPGTSFHYQVDTNAEASTDCSARISYTVTETLRTYPYL